MTDAVEKIRAEMLKCQERAEKDVAHLRSYWTGCAAGLETALVMLEWEEEANA